MLPSSALWMNESRSVVSNSLPPLGLYSHGILQARILEWVAFPFSRGSSQPRDRTQVSRTVGRFFTSWATTPPLALWPLALLLWSLVPQGLCICICYFFCLKFSSHISAISSWIILTSSSMKPSTTSPTRMFSCCPFPERSVLLFYFPFHWL